MLRRQVSVARIAAFMWLTASCLPLFAAPRSDALLPATTKGHLSIAGLERLEVNWQKTMFGQLAQDESMKPFVDDLRRQLQRKVANVQAKVGLSLGDLQGIATGEVSLSLVQPNATLAAVVLTADVTGSDTQAKELLAKIGRNLTKQQAVKETRNSHGIELTVYTLPEDATHRTREVVLFLHDNIFCASSNADVSADMVGRVSGDAKDSLRRFEPYRATLDRCKRSAQSITPDVRWFLEPFGYTKAYRSITTAKKKRRGKDLLDILDRQGFGAILGLGGHVSFHASDCYEILHRTAVFAPADDKADKGEKYRLAMRMLDFPASSNLSPLEWIPRDVATHMSFRWNVSNAFNCAESIVDEFIGEGGFRAALDGVEKGEYGPKVNLREELIQHLDDRVTVITDYDVPITVTSEHFLFAIEAKNSQAVDRAIRKLMESDPNAREREFEGHVVWELVEEALTPDIPDIDDDLIDDGPLVGEEEEAGESAPTFPNSCVCVAKGHMLFASNIDYLKKILRDATERETLVHTADFNQVTTMLDTLSPGKMSLRSFSRTDEEYRPTYELLRQGKMPESETLLGRILNQFLTDDDVELREQRFDGSKLPSFETVRRYFGPAGFAIVPEEDGWFLIGAMLRKDAE